MRKFYETKPVLFAILWIVLYVVGIGSLRGSYGERKKASVAPAHVGPGHGEPVGRHRRPV